MSVISAKDYRPARIDFDVLHDQSGMPHSFGTYESADDAMKFIGGNFTVVSQGIRVARHMDHFEKTEMRKKYNELLEDQLPRLEQKLGELMQITQEAKEKEKNAKALVDSTLIECRQLAHEVKRGLVEMELDVNYTVRIPFNGRYYFYTYINKELKQCASRDIPDHERNDLMNAMSNNVACLEKYLAGDIKTGEDVDTETGEVTQDHSNASPMDEFQKEYDENNQSEE